MHFTFINNQVDHFFHKVVRFLSGTPYRDRSLRSRWGLDSTQSLLDTHLSYFKCWPMFKRSFRFSIHLLSQTPVERPNTWYLFKTSCLAHLANLQIKDLCSVYLHRPLPQALPVTPPAPPETLVLVVQPTANGQNAAVELCILRVSRRLTGRGSILSIAITFIGLTFKRGYTFYIFLARYLIRG